MKKLIKVIAIVSIISYSYGNTNSDYTYIVKNMNGKIIDKCSSLNKNHSLYEFEDCESGDNIVMTGSNFRYKDTTNYSENNIRELPHRLGL